MAVPNLLETHVLRGMIYLPLYLAVSSVSSHRQLSSIIVATALLLIVFAAAATFQFTSMKDFSLQSLMQRLLLDHARGSKRTRNCELPLSSQ